MADIAMAFHFSLSDMQAMDLNQLMQWRERAAQRWNYSP
ncbi:GpE family phage tail protein [Xanthomonas sp. 60]